jgi:hypothetical protein
MTLFEVELDGGKQSAEEERGHPEHGEPERSGIITIEAEDAAAAKSFAEEHNPGLVAVSASKVK